MSTTVSYKGSTIATLNNETKTLTTAGTWVEGNITVTDTMSGVDIPVFTITFDSEWEEVTSITCNKTFTECLNLYEVEYDGTCPAYVIYTNGDEEYVGSAVGYEADSVVMHFVITPDLHADITYDRLEQLNFTSLPSGYPDNITITQNGVYNPTNFDHKPFWNVTVNVPSSAPNLQAKTNINPTESSQTITADSNYDGLSSVQINAISNTYVGSGITRRSSTDLIVSGATVTAPAGYYSRASKSVASGTEGTPTATKGTVSNHQVTVTPSVTNTTGYITGGTKTGTAVTVTASELASGNKEITQNGTNIDVVGYSTVSVAVPSSSTAIITDTTDTAGGTIRTITTTNEVHLQTKTITPTSTQQTVTPDTGYDGFSSVIVGASSGGNASYTRTVIAPQQTVTPTTTTSDGNTYYSAQLNMSSSLESGEEYIITYNGTEYFYTCRVLWGTNYLLGEINYFYGTTSLPYPFGILWVSGNTCRMACGDSTAVTVKIEKLEFVGSPSATAHTIYFEFSDSTNTTITAYYDDSFISDAITATTPTTYGQKTVTLAQLDGVTWYEVSGDNIPLNTELVDYTAVTTGKYVDDDGTIISGDSWLCVTDYLPIDSSMTFTFINRAWYGIGFYNASKTLIRGYVANDIPGATVSGDEVHGTLTSSIIPSNAAYVVLTGNRYQLSSTYLSLIRTA